MRWMVMMAAALLALAGCADHDKINLTRFEPLANDQFSYEVRADSIVYPPDDPAAESTRLGWLRSYLADNKLCPSGFRVTERTQVKEGDAAIGSAYRIYYRGECTLTAS